MKSAYPKEYITETRKSVKIITHPKTGKSREQKLRFPKGIRFGLSGITEDYDHEHIIKDAFTNIFKKAKDLEPDADRMEVDWLKDEQTIHIIFFYPDKNVHYFFCWWLDLREVPTDEEMENSKI
jgi:hypothetical protein